MNLIYRINKLLDNSNYTLLIILIPIIIANLLLTLTETKSNIRNKKLNNLGI